VDYKERILGFLDETNETADVEKIRKHCRIGNWNTALNNCLELFIQGKIRGERTSKGWIFWTQREIKLEPWEEAIGNFEALKISQEKVTLTLTHTLRNQTITFQKDTPEAQTLIKTLQKTPKGTKIAILKTDIPEKPIIIRTYSETPVANKLGLPLFQFRKSILWIAFKLVALKFTLRLFGVRLSWWF
jgi:hypothetical protein